MDWAERAKQRWVSEKIKPRRGLRVASDCSGLGSAEVAVGSLEAVGCVSSVSYAWAADWAAASQWWLNHVVGIPGEKIFGDMNQRKFMADRMRDTNMDQKQVTIERQEDLDLYVCGFPCTPFSSKGKQLGFDDVNSKPFWIACKTISLLRPKVVVLENVMGIMRKGGLDKVLEVLRVIAGYSMAVLVGASNHEYGIPQHRPRIYVVMVRRDSLRSHLADQQLQERMERFLDFMKVASPITWPTFLQRVGLPVATTVQNLTPSATACTCSFRTVCSLHACKCRACSVHRASSSRGRGAGAARGRHAARGRGAGAARGRGATSGLLACKWRVLHAAYRKKRAVRVATKKMLNHWRAVRTILK